MSYISSYPRNMPRTKYMETRKNVLGRVRATRESMTTNKNSASLEHLLGKMTDEHIGPDCRTNDVEAFRIMARRMQAQLPSLAAAEIIYTLSHNCPREFDWVKLSTQMEHCPVVASR